MENVVQLEFLHVGGPGMDRYAKETESKERRATNSPTKTIVRLYDNGQCMTRFLDKWRSIRRDLRHMKKECDCTRGWTGVWLRFRYARLVKEYSKEEEQRERLEFAQRFFTEQIEEGEDIVVGTTDDLFRRIEDNEIYDTRTAANKAKDVTITIFPPDDLCGDPDSVIALAM